jgi:hypothetical protein
LVVVVVGYKREKNIVKRHYSPLQNPVDD